MELYFYLQHILTWRLKHFIAYHYCSSTAPRLPASIAEYTVVVQYIYFVTPDATVLKEITHTLNNCIFILAIHGSLLFVLHTLSFSPWLPAGPPLT